MGRVSPGCLAEKAYRHMAASCVNLRDHVILGKTLELGSAVLFWMHITHAVFMPRFVGQTKGRERATVVPEG
jgi:hypothetical protein